MINPLFVFPKKCFPYGFIAKEQSECLIHIVEIEVATISGIKWAILGGSKMEADSEYDSYNYCDDMDTDVRPSKLPGTSSNLIK